MKLNKVIFILIGFILYAQFATAQNTDSAKTKLKSAAIDMMKSAGFCALISIDQGGKPIARTMDPFAPDSNFVVWFGTNPRSRKVKEIKRNPKVCLYYSNPESTGYVMIQGIAKLVNDPKEKEKRWKPGWSGFYQSRDKDYILIKVTPSRLELINYKLGIIGNPSTWEVPYINF